VAEALVVSLRTTINRPGSTVIGELSGVAGWAKAAGELRG
jgi:hypothetical protein